MSGGQFDYNQYKIDEIAEQVMSFITDNYSEEPNEWGYARGHRYSPETIGEFKRGLYFLKMAFIYAHRIDWLVSADDSEESFHNRLKEQTEDLNKKVPYKLIEPENKEPNYYGLTQDHTWLSISKEDYDRTPEENRMACYEVKTKK